MRPVRTGRRRSTGTSTCAVPRRPCSKRRSRRQCTMIFEVTPSQTVGPYFAIGVPFEGGNLIVPDGTPGSIRISGTIYDGRGDIIPDHLLEFWQPDGEGRFNDIY